MGFLKWMENLPRWAQILISLIAGWRVYEIVRAFVEKKDTGAKVIAIVLAVFAWVIDWVDFFMQIFAKKHLVVGE